MFEFVKVAWDTYILRDAIRKGQFGWKKAVFAAAFVLLLYAIAMPAVLYYDQHPAFEPWFLAAMALDGVLFLAFLIVATRWYLLSLRVQNSASSTSNRKA